MLRRSIGAALLAVTLVTAGGAASAFAAAPPEDLAQASIGALQSVVTVLGVRSDQSLQTGSDGRPRRPRSLASGIVIDPPGRIIPVASAGGGCGAATPSRSTAGSSRDVPMRSHIGRRTCPSPRRAWPRSATRHRGSSTAPTRR